MKTTKTMQQKYLTLSDKVYINTISVVFGLCVYLGVFVLLEIFTGPGGRMIFSSAITLFLFVFLPIFIGFRISKRHLVGKKVEARFNERL